MLLAVACGRPLDAVPGAPPEGATATMQWSYATYLLSNGDPAQARGYLERLDERTERDVSDPALLWRDIAEARLFTGDAPGTLTATARARQELAAEPNTAQFKADDRYLFARTIDALEAAASTEPDKLLSIATDEREAPSADAWYLLGWLHEQRGELEASRAPYRSYLERAPQWSFLRQAFEMRRHAQLVVR